ncbi:MAG: DUF3052 domain-containing protein [Halobacteriales archaeon]|nr:DUF3052 domain-containing protein [Halobacteriales archaeon]
MAKDVPSTKPRLDKLGVKPGMRVAVLGVPDTDFLAELAARGADVGTRPRKACGAVFVGVDHEAELAPRIARGQACMARDGMLWIVRPKGKDGVPEDAVMRAGKAAGLVDTKVVRFSATHTAEKFVYRLRDR